MQCLYCKRKLGLFASKKRPFCSEQHAVAYQDEQAGLALRRVMDPLFTAPAEKVPLQPGPRNPPAAKPEVHHESAHARHGSPQLRPAQLAPAPEVVEALAGMDLTPHQASAEPEAPAFEPIDNPPPLAPSLEQKQPLPHPPEIQTELEPFGFEAAPERAHLPEPLASLIDDENPPEAGEESSTEPGSIEAFPLESSSTQSVAEPASHRLHPAVEQRKPDWIEPYEDQTGATLSEGQAAPLDFETQLARSLPRELSLDPEALHRQDPLGAEQPSDEESELVAEPDEPVAESLAQEAPPERDPAPLAGPVPNGAAGLRSANGHAGRAPRMESRLDPPEPALRYPFADFAPAGARPGRLCRTLELPWTAASAGAPRALAGADEIDPPQIALRCPFADLVFEATQPGRCSQTSELLWTGTSTGALDRVAGASAIDPSRMDLRHPFADLAIARLCPNKSSQMLGLQWKVSSAGMPDPVGGWNALDLPRMDLRYPTGEPDRGRARPDKSSQMLVLLWTVSSARTLDFATGTNGIDLPQTALRYPFANLAPLGGQSGKRSQTLGLPWTGNPLVPESAVRPLEGTPLAGIIVPAMLPALTKAGVTPILLHSPHPGTAGPCELLGTFSGGAELHWNIAGFEGGESNSPVFTEAVGQVGIPAPPIAAAVWLAPGEAFTQTEVHWNAAGLESGKANSPVLAEPVEQARIPAAPIAGAVWLAPGEAFTRAEFHWNAAGLEGGETSSPVLAELAAQAAIPAPLIASAARFEPAKAFARVPQPHRAAASAIRWKVLSGLREAPAKVHNPRFFVESNPRLATAQRTSGKWSLPEYAAVWCSPGAEIRGWDCAMTVPSWPESQRFDSLHRVRPGSSLTQNKTWVAAQPQDAPAARQDARAVGERIRLPRAAAIAVETHLFAIQLAAFAWDEQSDRRHRYRPSNPLADPAGVQRPRAASLIEIPEAKLRESSPSDLPTPIPTLSWSGIRPGLEGRQAGSPVLLHPDVRAPKLAA